MNGQDLIPREVTGRLPLFTLTGTQRLRIEQHQGLTGFHDGKISFRTASGEVTVTGKDMRFISYSGSDAILCGRITGILFANSEDQA